MTPTLAQYLRILLSLFVCVLALAQIIIFPNADNITANGIVLGASLLAIFSMVRAKFFQNYPLSTFQILFFCACSLSLAVAGTLLDGNQLVGNLKQPFRTFPFLALTLLTLILSHWFYRQWMQSLRRMITNGVITKLGLFQVPSPAQIWIVSSVGLLAMAAARLTVNDTQVGETGGVGVLGKFIQGFIVFAYTPFVLPFLAAMQRVPQRFRAADFLMPGVYFVLIMGISLAANARGAMIVPVVMIVFSAGLLVATGLLSAKAFASRLWLVIAVVMLVGLAMLSDLVLAMQLARGQRGKVSPMEMMKLSVEIYGDTEKMERFRGGFQRARYLAIWDETYVTNPLLSRFITTKYHDLGFDLESKFDINDRAKLRDFHEARLVAIYPAPLVNLLPLGFKKSSIGIVSCGDFMFFLVGGTGLGGFRTGSMVAQGFGMWGWAFFPILAALSILVFAFSDSLIMTPSMQSRISPHSGLIAVSFVAMLNVYMLINLFLPESVDGLFSFLLRGFWQTSLLYAALLFLASPFAGKTKKLSFGNLSPSRRGPVSAT